MSRFINLGIAIVNTSYIIRVEMESDGRAEIYGNTAQLLRYVLPGGHFVRIH